MSPVPRPEGAVPQHQAGDRRGRRPRPRDAASSSSARRSRRSSASSRPTAAPPTAIARQLRHECPAPRAPRRRRRAGRRGHHRPVTRSSRRSRPSATPARAPVLRRHRPGIVHHGPGAARGGDHAADEGDRAGAPLRAAGRHGPDPRDRAAAAGSWSIEDACPGPRRRATRAAASAAWATWPASASTPARTSAPTARAASSSPATTDAREEDPHAAGLGRRRRSTTTSCRLQLPDGGHPGRDPARQAAPPRGLDRGAPRARRALRVAPRRRRPRPPGRDAVGAGTSTTCYAVRTREREALMKRAQRPGHPDRDPLPDPGAPAAGLRRPRRGARARSRTPRGRPTRFCRSRCTRR